MCTNNRYSLIVGEYAKRHYIKSFEKKYKTTWKTTWSFIEILTTQIYKYLTTTKVNKIHNCDTWYIAKCEFTIAWLNISTKASWNRIIVYVDEVNLETHILLLYAKTDVKWANETQWWEQEIKDNYKDIARLFSWL